MTTWRWTTTWTHPYRPSRTTRWTRTPRRIRSPPGSHRRGRRDCELVTPHQRRRGYCRLSRGGVATWWSLRHRTERLNRLVRRSRRALRATSGRGPTTAAPPKARTESGRVARNAPRGLPRSWSVVRHSSQVRQIDDGSQPRGIDELPGWVRRLNHRTVLAPAENCVTARGRRSGLRDDEWTLTRDSEEAHPLINRLI